MNFRKWLIISFFNLLIVATIGFLLRYKIAFSLPFINQKFLLHAHSHFAFTGWISQTIMVLMIARLGELFKSNLFKKYRYLLWGNLVTAFGMLLTFSFQGYGLWSISFSTLSIFVSFAFAIIYWRDLNLIKEKQISKSWFKMAFFCNAISSLGAFALAYMMANKIINQNWHLAAEYFFLHFQYNGWFFFTCMGLICSKFLENKLSFSNLHIHFKLFAIAVIPAFFLSTLWMKLPTWLYIIVVFSAFLQVIAWIYLINKVYKIKIFSFLNKRIANLIITLSAVAFTIKILLQLGSTIPSLSTLAFGFRPIVIGYLHLVLLGVISLSLIGYVLSLEYNKHYKLLNNGALFFAISVIINEILLMVQGVTALKYIAIPYINILLLFAAFLLFASAMIIVIGLNKSKLI